MSRIRIEDLIGETTGYDMKVLNGINLGAGEKASVLLRIPAEVH